jgi:hypothetical protein
MRLPIWRLRAAAVLLAGAFALHQLRYAILPDAHGDQGHDYLPAAAAMAAGVLALAALQFARTLLRAWRGRETAGVAPSLRRGWVEAALVLLAVHVAQEGAETAASGRPPASLAAGLWLAALLAVALGLLAALLLRGGAAAVALAARRSRSRDSRPERARPRRRPQNAAFRPASPLARHLAGRAPPIPLT